MTKKERVVKINNKSVLLVLLFVIMFGCATSAKYAGICNSWIGKDINSLIDSWGYPQNIYELPNGNKMYVFVKTWQGYMPQTAGGQWKAGVWEPYRLTGGGYYVNRSRTTWFETDANGIIIKYRFRSS